MIRIALSADNGGSCGAEKFSGQSEEASHSGLYMYIAGSHNMPLNCAKIAFIAFYGLWQCTCIAHVKKCNLRRFLSFLVLCVRIVPDAF